MLVRSNFDIVYHFYNYNYNYIKILYSAPYKMDGSRGALNKEKYA